MSSPPLRPHHSVFRRATLTLALTTGILSAELLPTQPNIDLDGNGDVIVTWNQPGVLKQSSDLKNWSNLYAATSPYNASTASRNSKNFFRLAMPDPPCPGSIADLNSVAWRSNRDHTSASFSTTFQDWTNDGYRLLDIESYPVGSSYRVGSVWQQNIDNRAWAALRNLTSAQFSTAWADYLNQGYRLIDQEAYTVNGQLYYAGVWEKNEENLAWASLRNLTSAQFSTEFLNYKDQYMPIDVEGYETANGLRYSVVWVENCGLAWLLRRNLTSSQMSADFTNYSDQGYRISKLTSYRDGNGPQLYAAIWVKNENNRGWIEYRDMTGTEFGNAWTDLSDSDFRLVDFAAYQTASGLRYAGVWRQND